MILSVSYRPSYNTTGSISYRANHRLQYIIVSKYVVDLVKERSLHSVNEHINSCGKLRVVFAIELGTFHIKFTPDVMMI